MADESAVLRQPSILEPTSGTFLEPNIPVTLTFSPLMAQFAEGVEVYTLQTRDSERDQGFRDYNGNLVPPFN